MPSTIDPAEVEKFAAMADEWWDPKGKFKPLHIFNPCRIAFIRDSISEHFKLANSITPLKNITLLDIGCGGGLIAEPMTRLGANVTAIDAAEKNIHIAKLHAEEQNLAINYQCNSAEELAKDKKQFDVVLALEIIEHVGDVDLFVEACSQLVKPGGLLFIATLNRTVKSYAMAILGAEYILQWLPKGTHDWKKFLKPSEIESFMAQNDLSLKTIQGMSFNPFVNQWSLSDDLDVNFMLVATK